MIFARFRRRQWARLHWRAKPGSRLCLFAASVGWAKACSAAPTSCLRSAWASLRSAHPTLASVASVGWVERSETHHLSSSTRVRRWVLLRSIHPVDLRPQTALVEFLAAVVGIGIVAADTAVRVVDGEQLQAFGCLCVRLFRCAARRRQGCQGWSADRPEKAALGLNPWEVFRVSGQCAVWRCYICLCRASAAMLRSLSAISALPPPGAPSMPGVQKSFGRRAQ